MIIALSGCFKNNTFYIVFVLLGWFNFILKKHQKTPIIAFYQQTNYENRYCVNFWSFSRVFWAKSASKNSTVQSRARQSAPLVSCETYVKIWPKGCQRRPPSNRNATEGGGSPYRGGRQSAPLVSCETYGKSNAKGRPTSRLTRRMLHMGGRSGGGAVVRTVAQQ